MVRKVTTTTMVLFGIHPAYESYLERWMKVDMDAADISMNVTEYLTSNGI